MFTKLAEYLQFPFVRYALIVGVLIALCSSLLGVTLVLKRFSFIGDGLSHVAFGAMAIASVMNLSNDMLLVMPVTIICAVILLAAGRRAKVRGDAAIAMLSVSALALAYLIMNIFSTSTAIVLKNGAPPPNCWLNVYSPGFVPNILQTRCSLNAIS